MSQKDKIILKIIFFSYFCIVKDESAALALVNLSKKTENLHIVCFAPLTNIALAMKVDPNFANRIEGKKSIIET